MTRHPSDDFTPGRSSTGPAADPRGVADVRGPRISPDPVHPSDAGYASLAERQAYRGAEARYQAQRDAEAQAQWHRLRRGRALGWIFIICLALFCWLCGFGSAVLTVLGG